MSIINIILALFKLIPKDVRVAAQRALAYTSWLKMVIETGQDKGLLDWTELDERLLEILEKMPFEYGDSILGQLRNLGDRPRKDVLSGIGAFITKELHGDINTSTAKTFFEINYSKQKA